MSRLTDFLEAPFWTFLGALFAALAAWITGRRKEKVPTSLRQIETIYTVLNTVLLITEADRVAIFKLHNSGGKIVPGERLYVSKLYEVWSRNIEPWADNWDHVEPSEGYHALLSKIFSSTSVVEVAKDVTKANELRDSFNKDNVKLGAAIPIYSSADAKTAYFLAVDFCSDAAVINATIRDAMRSAASKIRDALKG